MSISSLADNVEAVEIDFDGEDFCSTDLENMARCIREELVPKHPKFAISEPQYLSDAKTYKMSIHLAGEKSTIATLEVGEIITLKVIEIPLQLSSISRKTRLKPSPPDFTWRYALADPKSLTEIFEVLDRNHAAWDSWEECSLKLNGT